MPRLGCSPVQCLLHAMPKNKYDDTLTLLRALSAEAEMQMGLSNTRQRQRLIQELAALVKVCR